MSKTIPVPLAPDEPSLLRNEKALETGVAAKQFKTESVKIVTYEKFHVENQGTA